MWKIIAVDKYLCYNGIMDLEKYCGIIKNECSDKFLKFKTLLLEKNKVCNLTSICDDKGVFYKHFLDSVAGESLFPLSADVIEIGSGGGFPSLPLKLIRDDLKFTLIESTGKKCAFLNDVVDKMNLKCVQVLNMRAEEGAHSKNLREKFDVACARAVAQLNTLAEYCLPFVKVGGLFITYKGQADEEIKNAENAVRILGGEIESVIAYELPEDYGKRNLVVIRKIKSTPSAYPRGQGKERKNPL